VKLKKEADGRMFPVTNKSSTIINCFEKERKKYKINLLLKTKVMSVKKVDNAFICSLKHDSKVKDFKYDKIILASGSSKSGYKIASTLGHKIIKPVPSLFTFEISDSRLKGLEGVSTQNAEVKLVVSSDESKKEFLTKGPVLITHWGLSGPAIIKLSSLAARELYNSNYKAKLIISWVRSELKEKMKSNLDLHRVKHAKKTVYNHSLLEIPKRLWQSIVLDKELKYSELNKKTAKKIEDQIFSAEFEVEGKGIFKEEFVTCGGVDLKEIDFRTMQSKKTPGFYIVGEALNIDGITGGYNFQSAWSTGFIAGSFI